MTINKIQVEFEKGGFASILLGVKAPDRHGKLKIFGFGSITKLIMNGFLQNLYGT